MEFFVAHMLKTCSPFGAEGAGVKFAAAAVKFGAVKLRTAVSVRRKDLLFRQRV